MNSTRRSELISAISRSGDRYGYGPDGLIKLMEETRIPNTKDISDEQLEVFCDRHGIMDRYQMEYEKKGCTTE